MFGSWSRGDAVTSSDIDLLILNKSNVNHEFVERVDIRTEAHVIESDIYLSRATVFLEITRKAKMSRKNKLFKATWDEAKAVTRTMLG